MVITIPYLKENGRYVELSASNYFTRVPDAKDASKSKQFRMLFLDVLIGDNAVTFRPGGRHPYRNISIAFPRSPNHLRLLGEALLELADEVEGEAELTEESKE